MRRREKKLIKLFDEAVFSEKEYDFQRAKHSYQEVVASCIKIVLRRI